MFSRIKNPDAKIKKSHLILLGLVVLCGILLRVWQLHYSEASITLKGSPLHVQIAKNPKQWYKGLGGRDNLGKYDGMLFIFPFYDTHPFVMRDMRFSLDMVWLSGGVVVDIAPEVPISPQDRPYIPRVDNNAVLELPAGWVKEHDLKIGDKMQTVPTQGQNKGKQGLTK